MIHKLVNSPVADRQHSEPSSAAKQDHAPDLFVPHLVAAQAAATPDAPAVVAGKQVLTYGELDRRANQIGNLLRSYGVGPDMLVGLCMERSVALVVAALGTLKAGGGYVPMDPACPQERLAAMLNDAQPRVLLTEHDLTNRLPPGVWRIISVDDPKVSRQPVTLIESGLSADNLAYVIYTSGSTGRPKGVQIAHNSLSNLVNWHQCAFDVKRTDRASLVANPGFDAAVWELWPYLSKGASVHVADAAVCCEPNALRNWLLAEGITITFVPTPLADRMMGLDWPRDAALRTFLTGGDTLHCYPPADLPFVLVNNYGPTECTVVASSGAVLSHERPDVVPSIGRPITNTEVYILDAQMAQAAVGTVGEIHIGGAGLARGYLNLPELTAEKFVRHPFSSDPTARLYKTGDLARYLPDGQIAFMGRLDDQVKIRGYRIELNEVIVALNRHPMVETSLVLAREEPPGDKRLVAYVVPKSGTQPTDKGLRQFLSSQLPDYMVPSIFVRIESMPTNASGKIDRGAIPPPIDSNIFRDESYISARTRVEQSVTTMLAGLLQLEKVGVNDNFFLLGGNSLLGAQVIAEVRDIFGVELPLLSLFDHPTVVELSAEIERLLLANLTALTAHGAKDLTVTFDNDTTV